MYSNLNKIKLYNINKEIVNRAESKLNAGTKKKIKNTSNNKYQHLIYKKYFTELEKKKVINP